MFTHLATTSEGTRIASLVPEAGDTSVPRGIRFNGTLVDVGDYGLFTRAIHFEGVDYAGVKSWSNNDGIARLAASDGRTWQLGPTHGNNPLGFVVIDGELFCGVVSKVNEGTVKCTLHRFDGSQWHAGVEHFRAMTSPGILGLTAVGKPLWTDDNDWLQVGGYTLRHAILVGAYAIGLEQTVNRILAVHTVTGTGHVVINGAFQTHHQAALQSDGAVLVAVSSPAAELIAQEEWQAIGEAPLPEVDEWPRKLWISPFFGLSARYGNTSDLVGNTFTIVELESIDDGIASNQPLIVAPNGITMTPAVIDRTVAWWASAMTGEDLGALVDDYKAAFPEKPIVAYLDNDEWPSERPAWVDSRVWPSVQVYRFPNEPLDDFKQRTEDVVARVAAYDRPIWLTLRMDDFNHEGTVTQTEEAIPHYIDLARRYFVVGLHLFADRRPGGMEEYPSLRAWGHAMQEANPAERPNRFDYWTPESVDLPTTLLNKLQQETSLMVFDEDEKDYLVDLIMADDNDNVVPLPPVDEDELLAVVTHQRSLFDEELLTADQCVSLLNEAAFQLGAAWGLLLKEHGNYGVRNDGTRCSTDFLVRSDGLGYDVLIDAGNRDFGPGPATAGIGNKDTFDFTGDDEGRFVEAI